MSILDKIFPVIVKADYAGGVMVVEYSNGKVEKYSGSCTVWHRHPYMERPGTSMEHRLSQLLKYCNKWNGPYPTAHLGK